MRDTCIIKTLKTLKILFSKKKSSSAMNLSLIFVLFIYFTFFYMIFGAMFSTNLFIGRDNVKFLLKKSKKPSHRNLYFIENKIIKKVKNN